MGYVTALALAARGGDRVAPSSFGRLTWDDVARLVTAVAGRDLAEDAAQDTYLRALRALPAYRRDASARTWLLSIARRAAVDAVGSASRRRRLARLLTARAGPDTVEVGLADGVLTDQVLARLGTDRRTAFVLTQLLGFDYAGAAEICGCPVGTIRSRVARAREQLAAELPSPRPIPSAAATPSPSAGSLLANDRGAARAQDDEAVDGQPAEPAGPAGAAGSATRSAPRPRA